jgi:DNA polymerase III subunit gamma/tau
MENFIVSARKYRPSTFDMVVGQDSITNTLKNAIKNNYLAQSYLFCGPRGVGKTTCARIYAKTINCFNLKEDVEPCNECESCVSFNTLRSLNIHELDAASNNKVEDIRSLTDQVRIPPQTGKYSIYIIDEVHMLSSSAFNAFLKTLEEPPAHAIFILATTEKHKIIPTILSRCQIFDFNRIKTGDIVKRLQFVADKESVEYDEQALHIIAVKADGALRDALSIFDQIVSYSSGKVIYENVIANLNLLDHEYYFKIIDASLLGRYGDSLLLLDEIFEHGFDGHNFINGLGTHLRNLLISRNPETLKLLDTADSVRERYREQSSRCAESFLFKALDICSKCDTSYKTSKNQRLLLEISLCNISEASVDMVSGEREKKKSIPDNLKTASHNDSMAEASPSSLNESSSNLRQDTSDKKNREDSREIKEKGGEVSSSRKVTSTSTLSVKDLMKSDNIGEASPVRSEESSHDETCNVNPAPLAGFNDSDKLPLFWDEFLTSVQEVDQAVIDRLTEIKPTCPEPGKILFCVKDKTLEELFIQIIKPGFISFINERSYEAEVVIETEIENQSDESNSINYYTDDQKFDYLAGKNKPVKDMKRLFGLDFE